MLKIQFQSVRSKIYFTVALTGSIVMLLVLIYSFMILNQLRLERMKSSFFEKGTYNSSILASELNSTSTNLYSTANIISRFENSSDSILSEVLSGSAISLLENTPFYSGAWVIYNVSTENNQNFSDHEKFQIHYYYSLNQFIGKRNLSSTQRKDLINSSLYTVPVSEQIGMVLDMREESYTGNVFDNFNVISIVAPIIKNNISVGVVGVDIPVNYFNRFLLPYSQYSFSLFFNDKNKILCHSSTDLVGVRFSDYYVKFNSDENIIQRIESQSKNFQVDYNLDGEDYIFYFFPVKLGKKSQIFTYTLAVKPDYASVATNENTKTYIFLIFLFGIAASFFIGKILSDQIFQPLIKINRALRYMTLGDIDAVEELRSNRRDEISRAYKYINTIVGGFRNVVKFADKIKSGEFDYQYSSFGEADRLGNTLLSMQLSIRELIEKQNEIRKQEENRNWINVGISYFSNSLRRHSKNIKVFAADLIQELVEYLDVQVGGLYLMQKDKRNRDVLELIAAYAYDRNKFVQKTIMLKEGLVGTCAAEEQIVHLKKVPKDYISIVSGLGETQPQSLILIPLKVEDRVLGVLELASIKQFEKHQIEFLEKLSDNIALTIASVTINERTDNLVDQLRSSSDELRSQEEELRQNLEELQATQDEAAKRQFHLDNLIKAIDNSALTLQMNHVGKLLEINEQFLRLLNEPESKIKGLFYSEFFKFDNIKIDAAQFWSEIEKGYIQRQILHCRFSEHSLYILGTFTPLYDIEGNMDKVFMIGYDYTDNVNAEIMLKEKSASNLLLEKKQNELNKEHKHLQNVYNELFERHDIYDNLVNKVIARAVLDKNATILEVNTTLYELLELKETNITGRNLVEFSTFATSNEFRDFWQNLLTKKYYDRTFVFNNKLFKEFYYLKKDKVHDILVYNFVLDTSARNQENMADQSSAAMIKMLNSNLLITEFDAEGQYKLMNDKLLQLFKLTEKDFHRKNHKDFAVVDNVLKYHVLWSKLRSGEPQVREMAYEINAVRYVFMDHYFPTKNEKHEIEKIVVYSVDITTLRDRIINLTKSLDDYKKNRK